MKSSMIALSVATLLAFGAASAAPAASSAASTGGAKTAQQSKMSACASANKGKKGDDYKNAMSACLKGSSTAKAAAPKPMPATTPPTTSRDKNSAQQSKMSACATANKGKTGDDYKNAMSACLKAAPAASGK